MQHQIKTQGKRIKTATKIMSYKVVTVTDKKNYKEFSTFKEAIKTFKEEVDGWREYFEVEKISDVFYKVWHRTTTPGCPRYMYAGCVYITKKEIA